MIYLRLLSLSCPMVQKCLNLAWTPFFFVFSSLKRENRRTSFFTTRRAKKSEFCFYIIKTKSIYLTLTWLNSFFSLMSALCEYFMKSFFSVDRRSMLIWTFSWRIIYSRKCLVLCFVLLSTKHSWKLNQDPTFDSKVSCVFEYLHRILYSLFLST